MALTQVQGGMILASGQSIPKAALPTGSVLQVVSTIKTDSFTANTESLGTYTDITGLSVSITPSSATSKILVCFNIGACGTGSTGDLLFRLVRNSTAIAIGGGTYPSTVAIRTLANELTNTPSMTFLDSPSTTSATTYKVQGASAYLFGVNRRTADTTFITASTITVMEIAA